MFFFLIKINLTNTVCDHNTLSMVFYWLTLVEVGAEYEANARVVDQGLIDDVVYPGNFVWSSSTDWTSAADVTAWFQSLPAQLQHAYHGVPMFELLTLDELRSNLGASGLANLDDLIASEGEENLISFVMEFDWNGLMIDGYTLLKATTLHHWIIVDNKTDPLPKMARVNVQQLVPFQPLLLP